MLPHPPLALRLRKLLDKDRQKLDANGAAEALKRCLQGERVSLDLQGVRERVLMIGKVVPVAGDVRGAEVCSRRLVG
jgi:U3 small nucleolar RNA-associated protein 20